LRSRSLAVAALFVISAWTADELKMLHDPGGWEYITVSEPEGGIQTTHTCFDGKPHPEECSGKLILRSDNTFSKQVFIRHQEVSRTGTYKLDGDRIAFFDEFGNQDGPYTIHLDTKSKLLTLDMPQLHIELELEKQYREDVKKNRKPEPGQQ
jgi:hypothetical protein